MHYALMRVVFICTYSLPHYDVYYTNIGIYYIYTYNDVNSKTSRVRRKKKSYRKSGNNNNRVRKLSARGYRCSPRKRYYNV